MRSAVAEHPNSESKACEKQDLRQLHFTIFLYVMALGTVSKAVNSGERHKANQLHHGAHMLVSSARLSVQLNSSLCCLMECQPSLILCFKIILA